MISESQYNEIAAHWDGEVFQTWARIKKSMPHFEKVVLPHLAGKRVLEIGCNAGIYAWHIAKVAKSYHGIDIGENFIRQARETAKFIQGAPTTFTVSALRDFPVETENYDAIFASYVLYHLNDAEIDLFEKKIAPRADTIAVQIRANKRRSSNSCNLMKPANVVALFDRAGFDCTIRWAHWWHSVFVAVAQKRK